MAILEKHGIDDAIETRFYASAPSLQSVTVTDGKGEVILHHSSLKPAGLTPAQARMIARHLYASANRVEKARAIFPPAKPGGESDGTILARSRLARVLRWHRPADLGLRLRPLGNSMMSPLTPNLIKDFFAELREDGYNQYMLYPLDEIEKSALTWVRLGKAGQDYVEAWILPECEPPDALEGAGK